eukprot:m.117448 g.117448  ORF g.117448 m.117448 type:complete len:92 (-) comp15427_c3_seq7:19-294(-)
MPHKKMPAQAYLMKRGLFMRRRATAEGAIDSCDLVPDDAVEGDIRIFDVQLLKMNALRPVPIAALLLLVLCRLPQSKENKAIMMMMMDDDG